METFFAPPPAPLLWGAAALILGAVVWAVLRRLVKLALVLGLGLFCLFAFFELTGTEPPPSLDRARRDVEDGLAEGARRGAEAATSGVRDLGDGVRDAATEALRDSMSSDARTTDRTE